MKRITKSIRITILLMVLCLNASLLTGRHKKHTEPQVSYTTTIKQEPTLVIEDTKAVITETPFNIPSEQKEVSAQNNLLATIQKDLQNAQYRQDILPNNFGYLSQLLQHGSTTKQSPEYAQNVLSLFSKLLKGSEYVNSYVFADLIKNTPDLLKHYFNSYQVEAAGTLLLANDLDMLERLERTISHLVFNKFTQDFGTCKANPKLFLDDLSQRIVSSTSQEINMELLRQMLIRFFEVGLSKLVWNPHDAEKSWESVKTMSQDMATLLDYNIIGDLNDLDELYWTLLHRYRYFLELHQTDLSLSFYQKIKSEITSKKVMLLELEEQETFIEPKASVLLQTILAQEAKKRMEDVALAAAVA